MKKKRTVENSILFARHILSFLGFIKHYEIELYLYDNFFACYGFIKYYEIPLPTKNMTLKID